MANDYALKFVISAKDNTSTSLAPITTSFQKLRREAIETYKAVDHPARSTGFKGMIGDLKGMGTNLSKGFGQLGAFGGMIGGVAGGAFAFKEMINNAMDLDHTMAKIASRIPGQRKKLGELRDGLQELALDSGKDTSELGEAMFDLAQEYTNASAPELFARMKAGVKLSKLAFSDATTSVDYLSRLVGSFGKDTPEAMEQVGAMTFQAMKKADVGLEEFASTMSSMAPNASALGIGMEDLFAMFSTFADGKEQFNQVGTSLNFMLKGLINAGPAGAESEEGLSELDKAIKQLGFDTGKDLIGKHGLVGAIEKLTEYSKKSDVPLNKLIGTGRGAMFSMRLMKEGTKGAREEMARMPKAVEEMNKAIEEYDRVNESTKAWNQFKETGKVVSQDIGGVILPGMTFAFKEISTSIRTFRKDLKDIMKGDISIANVTDTITNLYTLGGAGLAGRLAGKAKSGVTNSNMWQDLVQRYRHNGGYETGKYIESNGRLLTKEEYAAEKKKPEQVEIKISLPTDEEGNPMIDASSDTKNIKKGAYIPTRTVE